MPNATDPKILYHYTSMSGLLGIITSATLWASHIRYLNDRTEQTHLWQTIKNLLDKRLTRRIRLPKRKLFEDLRRAIEMLLDPSVIEGRASYISSFSANGDVLSQWLGYCPHGNGFAIGFDTACLRANERTVRQVQYGSSVDLESWDHMLDYYIREPTLGVEVMTIFASFIKDASFLAEEEYRLVQTNPDPKTVHFRPGHSMLIPYIEFKLMEDPYFITEVVVGPCPNPALSIRSVKLLFASKGRQDVTIRESVVPYRSW